MTIIGWMVFGLLVGVVAKLLTPGSDPGGLILTMVLGIAGDHHEPNAYLPSACRPTPLQVLPFSGEEQESEQHPIGP